MAVMVTGGAGYLGSHMVKALEEQGQKLVVVDNLSTGFHSSVKDSPLVVCDLHNRSRLIEVIHEYGVDAIVHFAAFSLVGESMDHPSRYYNNNVAGTLSLLDAMRETGVKNIVFSSTASVYGIPPEGVECLTEDIPRKPINVYGRTKAVIEDMLGDFGAAYGINSVTLRYFNVAGAHPSGTIGEAHNPETHLIPRTLKSLLDHGDPLCIYGADYDTPDGTCIRDYIHVTDLIMAHLLALKALGTGSAGSSFYNLGSGTGYSVRQVVDAVQEVTGKKLDTTVIARRSGDPAYLVASSEHAARDLGWKVEHDLKSMIESAWKWHSTHPCGYA